MSDDPWFHDKLTEYHNRAIDKINRQIGNLMRQRAEHCKALDELTYGTPENVETSSDR